MLCRIAIVLSLIAILLGLLGLVGQAQPAPRDTMRINLESNQDSVCPPKKGRICIYEYNLSQSKNKKCIERGCVYNYSKCSWRATLPFYHIIDFKTSTWYVKVINHSLVDFDGKLAKCMRCGKYNRSRREVEYMHEVWRKE